MIPCDCLPSLKLNSDIDQWNKVTQVLGTPPAEFFKQLQPSVSMLYYTCIYQIQFSIVQCTCLCTNLTAVYLYISYTVVSTVNLQRCVYMS